MRFEVVHYCTSALQRVKKQSRMFSIKLKFWLVPFSWIIHLKCFSFHHSHQNSEGSIILDTVGYKIAHCSSSMESVCFCEK
jgi:hypothetical protein